MSAATPASAAPAWSMSTGKAVKRCTALAVACDGADVTTIEGLAKNGKLHPMQEAFREHHGLQCGFCTPGMIMAAVDIVKPQGQEAVRGDDPPRARGQYLPLHRLPQHRHRHSGRRAQHVGRRAQDQGARHERYRHRRSRQSARKTSGSSPARAGIPTISTCRRRPTPISCAARMPMRTIKSIDTAKRQDDAGRARRASPARMSASDKIGGLICGWMIHSKDGSPMKAGPHPILAQGKVRYVGDHVAVVVAETQGQAKAAAAAVDVTYGVLPHVVDRRQGHEAQGRRSMTWLARQPGVQLVDRRRRRQRTPPSRRRRMSPSSTLVNNRLIPNAMEPRAAIGSYDTGGGSLHALHDEPEPACGASRDLGFPRPGPRAQAAGDRAGCRRRLRLEDLHLCRGSGLPLGLEAGRRPAGQVDGRAHRKPSCRRAWPRPRDPCRAGYAMRAARSRAMRVHTIAAMGAYLSTFASCVPTYLYATLLSGQYNIPKIYARGGCGLHQHRSGRRLSRRRSPGGHLCGGALVETAARELKIDPAEFRRRNFITQFPHQTPVIMCYDAGDYDASLDKALEHRRLQGLRGAQGGISQARASCAASASRPISRPAASRRRRRWARSGAGVGLWESAEVRVNPGRHGGGADRLAQPRPGPRDDLRPARVRPARRRHRQCLDRPWRHRQGAVRHGHLRLALGCGRHDGHLQGARQDRGQGQARLPPLSWKPPSDDVEFKDGTFTVKGTDKKMAFGEVALAGLCGAQVRLSEIEPGLKESAFHDPTNFMFPAGVPHLRSRGRSRYRGHHDCATRRRSTISATLINPMIVEGQVHGGIAQGVGQALSEGCVYDEESGQLMTGSYMDY